ncbi:hypothetical protein GTQ43_15570 [Nostoc sp. KVJ3]|uniref:hypothetical protein n=1 Tax=Nostoc sp. KVJ3 TaxID=457945 RepID=UPI0022371BAD|nr:hypothetical protein [Nostoc sp. KVJ3]MCW5315176.1 hypothetical protein [Nostoc sp. KVJ3]
MLSSEFLGLELKDRPRSRRGRTRGAAYILHQATGSRGYTGKTHLCGLKTLDFLLVHGGGLCLYSRDF